MKRFTEEQLERARAVSVIELAKEQGMELERHGHNYRAKSTGGRNWGGLLFNDEKNMWNWVSGGCGGNAIHFVMEFKGLSWVDAVYDLLGESENVFMVHDSYANPQKEEKPKVLTLPEKNDTYKHVYAYLIKTRGIDKEILDIFVKNKLIYEDKKRNCVFVGLDEDGTPRHAAVRSTNDQKKFRMDASGSDKKYAFHLAGTTDVVNVFEAPIDLLSYMTLQKRHQIPRDAHYVTLSGTALTALDQYLELHPEIKRINVCTDNDDAGKKCCEKIFEKYGQSIRIVRHRPHEKDYNEDLKEALKETTEENHSQRKTDSSKNDVEEENSQQSLDAKENEKINSTQSLNTQGIEATVPRGDSRELTEIKEKELEPDGLIKSEFEEDFSLSM